MTDWIKHDCGPQPVADDVWVEINSNLGALRGLAEWFPLSWEERGRYRILNQHLIDAKQAEIDALKEDLAIWDSVFPDLLPDRLKSDKQLAEEDVAAKIDAARKEGLQKGLDAFDAARLAVEGDIQKLCDAARKDGLQKGLDAFDAARLAVEGDIQKLCDAARLEGIRLGLEAAERHAEDVANAITALQSGLLIAVPPLDPETIARNSANKETAR